MYTRWFEGKVEYMPGKHMAGLPPGQAVLKLVHCTELTACVYGAQAGHGGNWWDRFQELFFWLNYSENFFKLNATRMHVT